MSGSRVFILPQSFVNNSLSDFRTHLSSRSTDRSALGPTCTNDSGTMSSTDPRDTLPKRVPVHRLGSVDTGDSGFQSGVGRGVRRFLTRTDSSSDYEVRTVHPHTTTSSHAVGTPETRGVRSRETHGTVEEGGERVTEEEET